ncbi:MAG TPA: hypothetical protein VKR83_01835 [Ktedonobacteraceae bacterium]|nr:hypothetical protein [Ktedonobacteraceae bacterium]
MDISNVLSETNMNTHIHSINDMRLAAHWRIITSIVWLVLAVLTLLLFVATFPFHSEHLHTICADIMCGGSASPAEVARELSQVGLTIDFFAKYTLTLQVIFVVGYFLVAAIVFWCKPGDRMALLVSLFLMTFVIAFTDAPRVLRQAYPTWGLPIASVGFIGEMTLPLFFYLFPNGRFVPRWTRWLLIGWLAWGIINYYFPDTPIKSNSWYLLLEGLAFIAGLGSIVMIQVYRYRHISSPTQRQQTKWVLFGMVGGLGGFFGAGVLGFILPHMLFSLYARPELHFLIMSGILANSINYLAMLLVPLSIGIAVLRYRLWDIDILINRTLVYGSLTLLLAFVYFACVIGLQFLLQKFIGEVSQAPLVVVSTLVSAALFQPLRKRIQQIIDCRFYRKKYDAARALATFGAMLHSEVDLDELSDQLVAVVQETLQPKFISLWLHPPENSRERITHQLPYIAGEEKLTV